MKKRALPKPISKRALEKEYEELSIQTNYTIDSSTDEGKNIIKTIHYYLNCFSNLYGYIDAYRMLDLLDYYEPKIMNEVEFADYIALLNTISLEEQNYYILRISDAFDVEDEEETDLMLVNKELVNHNARIPQLRFMRLYDIERSRQERENLEPYIPGKEKLSEYEDKGWYENTIEALNLINFLNKLKVSDNCILVDYYGYPIAGKKLKNVVMVEKYEKKWIQETKQEWRRKKLEDELVKSYSIKIFETVKRYIQYDIFGTDTITNLFQRIIDMLELIDVTVDEGLLNQLLKLYMSLNNNVNNWPMFGWAPHELSIKRYDKSSTPKLTFGPNLQKQFESGEINKEEYIKQIEKLGIEVAEEEKDTFKRS